MSLSQRLKQAQYERRRSAGLPVEPPDRTRGDETTRDGAVVELDGSQEGVVIDLTRSLPHAVSPTGIDYDPVRYGDATGGFGDFLTEPSDNRSTYPCPRCGGSTQIDLIDQVHQTISLSCLNCFHMFRVDA